MASKRSSSLQFELIALFFMLGFLGTIWYRAISTLLKNTNPSTAQYSSIAVLAILTVIVLYIFNRTSVNGLVVLLNHAWPFKKSSANQEKQ